ncbi:hypothetical protein Poly51_02500 [Rubripirellula tenax]|uniref:Uncharacterized protein n=1 Tax=Rubripirellula tenax TaxID=2528015 RepID=A0A5C6FIR9_9BACT|nr:hypothetical protein [Rubripirellula tenax]TWU59977.1 hypothetical protein Poly51_02500 [Rubripirellula tenax]
MFRLIVIVAAIVWATEAADVLAQHHHGNNGHRHSSQRFPTQGYSSSFGITIGGSNGFANDRFAQPGFAARGFGAPAVAYPSYGYGGYRGLSYPDPYRFDGFGYDPYRYGSFRAPDLMQDPYFQWQHKYDSAFPGRRRSR